MPTGTRLEAVDAEVAERLRQSGMVAMAFAPESGSAATRALVKKRMGDARLLAAMQAAAGAGLNVAFFIVLGFPHDTRARLAEAAGVLYGAPASAMREYARERARARHAIPSPWSTMLPVPSFRVALRRIGAP